MVYLYDGSLEGFFTAVFEANRAGVHGVLIQKEKNYLTDLFEEPVFIRSRKEDAHRVLDGIAERIGKPGLNIITRAFLSEAEGCEDLVHRFIRKAMRAGAGIIDNLSDPDALGVMRMSQKTMREYHRFLGLLRFRRLSTGEYYAPFEPDTNLIPLLGRHFASRFPDQSWMIHDTKRNSALVHIGGRLEITNLEDPAELSDQAVSEIERAEDTDPWAELWRIYHRQIGITERANPRLQMQFMPKKHWSCLTEMKDRLPKAEKTAEQAPGQAGKEARRL